jgi:hypothetical protein
MFAVIAYESNSLAEKEAIETVIETVIEIDMIQEDIVILTRNVLTVMATVIGPVIAQRNETEANATTAGNSDINLENVRNEKEV